LKVTLSTRTSGRDITLKLDEYLIVNLASKTDQFMGTRTFPNPSSIHKS